MPSIHDPITCIEEDILERRELAEHLLRKLTADECLPAVGLFGGWGTGKSSLLKLLELKHAELDRDGQIVRSLQIEVIDAWKYDGTGNLFIPVITRLMEEISPEDFQKASTYYKRLLAATGLSAMDVFMRKVFDLKLEDAEKLKERAEQAVESDPQMVLLKTWKELIDETEKATAAFETVVSTYLERKGKDRLVLCIDNLDRCTPDIVVRFFESVKNYLIVPNCVWLLAMDSSVVARFIGQKYGGVIDGHSYLDKIIPEQFHIPLPSPQEDRERIAHLLAHATPEIQDGVPVNWEEYAQLPQVMVPRRMIKSAVKYAETRRSQRGFSSSPTLIFTMILLYHCWPDFYEILANSHPYHFGKILDNFDDTVSQKFLIDDTIRSDPQLRYFMQVSILPWRNQLDEIRTALHELRRVGLP